METNELDMVAQQNKPWKLYVEYVLVFIVFVLLFIPALLLRAARYVATGLLYVIGFGLNKLTSKYDFIQSLGNIAETDKETKNE